MLITPLRSDGNLCGIPPRISLLTSSGKHSVAQFLSVSVLIHHACKAVVYHYYLNHNQPFSNINKKAVKHISPKPWPLQGKPTQELGTGKLDVPQWNGFCFWLIMLVENGQVLCKLGQELSRANYAIELTVMFVPMDTGQNVMQFSVYILWHHMGLWCQCSTQCGEHMFHSYLDVLFVL